MKRILLVDDHALFRSTLIETLERKDKRLHLHGVASAKEAMAALAEGKWHLIFLDLSLKGESGLLLLPRIHDLYPNMPVLVVTMHEEVGLVQSVFEAGAKGYISKSTEFDTLQLAISRLLDGGVFIGQTDTGAMAAHANRLSNTLPRNLLSERELQTLALLAQGLRLTDVAQVLRLKITTVSTFRARLFGKMGWDSDADMFRALFQEPHI